MERDAARRTDRPENAAVASLGRATLSWTGRAIVGIALLAIGYVAADELGGGSGLSLTLLFAVHQAVVLGRVALRASWMARALAPRGTRAGRILARAPAGTA